MAYTDANNSIQHTMSGTPSLGGAGFSEYYNLRIFTSVMQFPVLTVIPPVYTHERLYFGPAVTAAATALLYVRCLADGAIQNNAIYLPNAVAGTPAIFNIRRNGTTLFSTPQRPTIAVGQSQILTANLSFTVAKGDELTLDVDDPTTGGLIGPLVWMFDVQ